MAKAKPKFKIGDPVNYPAHPDGKFEAGKGVVDSINPHGGEFTYSVKDEDGKLLSPAFKEGDLSHC